jgi:hypothetical protein
MIIMIVRQNSRVQREMGELWRNGGVSQCGSARGGAGCRWCTHSLGDTFLHLQVLPADDKPHTYFSPHTGMGGQTSGTNRIPAACITIEEAQMLRRMQERGERLRIQLVLTCTLDTPTTSR